MGDDATQTRKSDDDAEGDDKKINDPLVRTDVEAPRKPFEAPSRS